MIQLGDKVKCTHTGFEGTVLAKTEFINGCVQFLVVPKIKKGEKYPEEIGIDEGSLEVIKSTKKKSKDKDPGGPISKGLSMRGH